jgi:DNA ligase-associated metallophosphoesterase
MQRFAVNAWSGAPGISPATITVAGNDLHADPAGALYWAQESLLVVADLHLEKGSSYATRGVLLPPYDTAATLARLSRLLARYAPHTVIALGDSFHDGGGTRRIADSDRAVLGLLQRGRDWIWIAGNHDPEPATGVGGISAPRLAIGTLTFCHEPNAINAPITKGANTAHDAIALCGEVAGHLHPVARVSTRGHTVSRRCFAADAQRIVMPAFGTYAGGLNVRDRAFANVFGSLAFTAHMLGDGRLYTIAANRCAAG